MIDTLYHNNIEIMCFYDKSKKRFYGTASIGISTDVIYTSIDELIEAIKSEIDSFLETSPKTYSELAKMITKSLVWTGYDECHADEKVIERLVSDFIKNLKQKKR